MSWVQERNGISQARWASVASNSDGTKFIVCAAYGSIWIYSGSSWVQQTVDSNSNSGWSSVASNSDGTKFIVCNTEDNVIGTPNVSNIWIYNGTWVKQIVGIGSHDWHSVASNSYGTKFIACATGSIWIYNDTWVEQTAPGTANWTSVASDSDGTKFIACADGGSIWIYNGMWVEQIVPGTDSWTSVASNSDGTKFIACAGSNISPGSIWIYNGIWVEQTAPGTASWTSVASDSDGTKFIACADGGSIWIYNGTWVEQTVGSGTYRWRSVALNSDGTKFIAAENNGGSDGYIYTLSLTVGNICFPAGTPVLTDQGLIAIDKIDIKVHTLNQKRIVDITKTVAEDEELVFFEKDALGPGLPSQETRMSLRHCVLYNNFMREAHTFVYDFDTVHFVPYTKEPLYNVLLEEHSTMLVNNLICETLSPENIFAKLHTKQCKYPTEVKHKLVNYLDGLLEKKDYTAYNQFIKTIA